MGCRLQSCGPKLDGSPGYSKQAIHLFTKPQAVGEELEVHAGSNVGQAWSGIEVSGTFDAHTGDIALQAISWLADQRCHDENC